MLARSTASRHGDGRTCTKATSISMRWPSFTSRLAGLMSRWASPASHSWRISARPSSMICVVDLGVADLHGAVEELGDEHVLALGRQLDDPDRLRRRDADVAQQAHGVVLVLDQTAHRLERRLVLEAAVEHRAAELVPAVGADVVHRVELPEQVRVGVTGDPQPQRRRAARAGQPDRLHVDDRDAELVLDRTADRLAAAPAHVEVGRLALPVAHREQLVRREEAEGDERDGDAESDPGQHVEGVVDAEVQAADDDHGDDDRTRLTLATRPRASGHDDGVDDADDGEPDHGARSPTAASSHATGRSS